MQEKVHGQLPDPAIVHSASALVPILRYLQDNNISNVLKTGV